MRVDGRVIIMIVIGKKISQAKRFSTKLDLEMVINVKVSLKQFEKDNYWLKMMASTSNNVCVGVRLGLLKGRFNQASL